MEDQPLTVLFALLVAFVANVPIWMWASNDYPRMRVVGAVGFVGTIAASIATAVAGRDSMAAKIGIGALVLFLVCWGWIVLRFAWSVLLRSAPSLLAIVSIGAVLGTYTILAAGDALFEAASWGSFAGEYSGTLILAAAVWYIWACRDIREVGGRESFDLGGARGAADDAEDGEAAYGGFEPRSGGVFDDPAMEDQRLIRDSEKIAGRLSDDVF